MLIVQLVFVKCFLLCRPQLHHATAVQHDAHGRLERQLLDNSQWRQLQRYLPVYSHRPWLHISVQGGHLAERNRQLCR
jgi:hypothetical protein